jgi:hypothetical protein
MLCMTRVLRLKKKFKPYLLDTECFEFSSSSQSTNKAQGSDACIRQLFGTNSSGTDFREVFMVLSVL